MRSISFNLCFWALSLATMFAGVAVLEHFGAHRAVILGWAGLLGCVGGFIYILIEDSFDKENEE